MSKLLLGILGWGVFRGQRYSMQSDAKTSAILSLS